MINAWLCRVVPEVSDSIWGYKLEICMHCVNGKFMLVIVSAFAFHQFSSGHWCVFEVGMFMWSKVNTQCFFLQGFEPSRSLGRFGDDGFRSFSKTLFGSFLVSFDQSAEKLSVLRGFKTNGRGGVIGCRGNKSFRNLKKNTGQDQTMLCCCCIMCLSTKERVQWSVTCGSSKCQSQQVVLAPTALLS